MGWNRSSPESAVKAPRSSGAGRGARASTTSGTKGRRENTLRFMGADGIPLPPQKLVVLKKAENCLGCTSAAETPSHRAGFYTPPLIRLFFSAPEKRAL